MRFVPVLLFAFMLVGPVTGARAQAPAEAPPPTAEARAAEGRAAWQAAADASVAGPTEVTLRDQAKLAIPSGAVFIPQPAADRLSRALGNRPGPNALGMVTTLDDADQWIVFLTWAPEGYVKDDEASELDADTLLKNLREGQVDANADRVSRGFPALELTGWFQPPRYDRAKHQLAWSLGVKAAGETDAEASINFNTRALGREGYISLNLVTGVDAFPKDRAVAETLLAGLQFEPGKGYGDFNASTDHVAEYGLLALIGVVAAKKLGFLALAGIFALKFAKVGLLGAAGIGLAVKRFFRRTPKA